MAVPIIPLIGSLMTALDIYERGTGAVEWGKRKLRESVVEPVADLIAANVETQTRLALIESMTGRAGLILRDTAILLVAIAFAGAFLGRAAVLVVVALAGLYGLPATLRVLIFGFGLLRLRLAMGIPTTRLLRFSAYAGLMGRPEFAAPEVQRALWASRQVEGPGDVSALAWRLSATLPSAILRSARFLALQLFVPLFAVTALLRMLLTAG